MSSAVHLRVITDSGSPGWVPGTITSTKLMITLGSQSDAVANPVRFGSVWPPAGPVVQTSVMSGGQLITGAWVSWTVIVLLHFWVVPPGGVTRTSNTQTRTQVPLMSMMKVGVGSEGSRKKPNGHSSNHSKVAVPAGSRPVPSRSTAVAGPVHSKT